MSKPMETRSNNLQPARWLDPRPVGEARQAPFAEAANIPVADLAERIAELPAPGGTVPILGPAALACEAIEALRTLGRDGVHDDRTPEPADGATRYRLWNPTPVLADWCPPGRTCVDLGCGGGRDVVYLAGAGWDALGLDWLPDAIHRGQTLGTRYLHQPVQARWQTLDLEAPEVSLPGRFDLITGFRFLHRPLLRRLHKWLNPGGHILWETFTTEHRARHGKPSRDAFVLQSGELPTLLEPNCEIVRFEEAWHGEVHTARGLARLRREGARE